METVKIFCGFEDKDLIKACGARFNADGKFWYIDLKYMKITQFNKLLSLINERKYATNKINFVDISTELVEKRFKRLKNKYIKDREYNLIKDCYLNPDSD